MISIDEQGKPSQIKGGVFHENRNQHTSETVFLPFTAVVEGLVFKGGSFSMNGFDIPATEAGDWIKNPNMWTDRILNCRLRISLYGFVCEIPATARYQGIITGQSEDVLSFKFQTLGENEKTTLHRIIRAYQSGLVARPSDLLDPVEDQTVIASGGRKTDVRGSSKTFTQLVTIFLSTLVLIGSFTVFATAIYNRFFSVKAEFATVTAPRLDLSSPLLGQVDLKIDGAGTDVARDQPLFSITSKDLDADIAEATALSAFLEAKTSDIAAVAENANPADDSREADLAKGRLKALELRKSALEAYSPCDCRVVWAAENGTWREQGQPVVTLAKNNSETLRVDALVPLEDASDIYVGEPATVKFLGSEDAITAKVADIILDPSNEARYGLPDNLVKSGVAALVVLDTDQAIPADQIGAPIEVRIQHSLRLPGWSD